MIYFDNAATTFPKPAKVVAAVNQAMSLYGANPGRSGHKMSLATAEQIYNCREKLAELFHANRVEDVVFTQNCTQSLNIAIKGILRWGDHAIISDLEHNSVLRPMEKLKNDGLITYDILKIGQDAAETVARLEKLIRPNTKLIAVTHGSNAFGICVPIEAISNVAKKHGCYFLVDSAQSAGVLPIDIQKLGIDFLCMPGHKGLYGPSGTGVLIANNGERFNTLIEGGTGSVSLSYKQPDFMPDRLESGTLNTIGIIGLSAGIDFVNQTGLNAIYEHEFELTNMIDSGLRNIPGVILYTAPPRKGQNLPVISFNLSGKKGDETAGLLDEAGFALRGGFHCAPLAHKKMGTLESGTARVSIGAFNTKIQAQAFCNIVKKFSK